jgi:hypothetical protein
MEELIFNLFVFEKNDLVYELGVRPHRISGTDEEKIKFLSERVDEDLLEAKRFPVPPNFLTIHGNTVFPSLTAERYRELCINQSEVIVFEGIFEVYNAPKEPLMISTMVVDGAIKIDAIEEINSNPDNYPNGVIEHTSEDYLKKYLTEEGFDIGKLLEDDFLAAIRLLLQISCIPHRQSYLLFVLTALPSWNLEILQRTLQNGSMNMLTFRM